MFLISSALLRITPNSIYSNFVGEGISTCSGSGFKSGDGELLLSEQEDEYQDSRRLEITIDVLSSRKRCPKSLENCTA